jgi:hypothetical protein
MSAPPPLDALPPLDAGDPDNPSRRAITLRSVLLGSILVCIVCGLTPYNDYIVYNTFMVGSYLPPAFIFCFFILIVFINGPLHRWAPRRALGSGELAVMMAMMLVGCAIPSQGLLRYFLPQLVAPFYFGSTDPAFWKAFEALGLPHWLFAVHAGAGVGPAASPTHSAVMRYFYQRLPEGEFIPWRAWIPPLLGWGVFLAGWAASLIGLATILRRQWADNERLAFPLAQLELALIQPPARGRGLNDLFRSRALWIGLVGVFCIQSLAALRQYYPRYIPEIPLSYDLRDVFSEEPWSFLGYLVKRNTIYFTFIGITFFLQSRVGISLWGIFLLSQLVQMETASLRLDVPAAAWRDQHLGASIAFVAGVAWVGRQQWALAARHLFRGRSATEKRRGAVSYRSSALAVLIGVLVMVAWMMAIDVWWPVALGVVAFILLAHVVVARVVAETGFPFFRFMGQSSQIYDHLPAGALTPHDLFISQMAVANGPLATRESVMVFAMHGIQVSEGVTPPVGKRGYGGLLALLAWSWVLGLVVALSSSLYCYYTYAMPITTQVQDVVNPWGSI